MVMEILSDLQIFNYYNNFNEKTKTGTYITDIAKLMPLQNVFQRMLIFFNSDYRKDNPSPPHVTLFNELSLSGESELFEILKVCDKSAAVVSEYLTNSLEQKLRRENIKNVLVGKDRYLQAYHGFHLKGKMHRNVAKRMAAFKVSGILDWWPEYARKYFEFSGEREEKTTPVPSMEGNIQIIFYLLVGGIILSIFSFTLESVLNIRLVEYKGLRFLMNIFWSMAGYADKLKYVIWRVRHTKVVKMHVISNK